MFLFRCTENIPTTGVCNFNWNAGVIDQFISPERGKLVVWKRKEMLMVCQAVVLITRPVQDPHALRTANLRREF